MTCLPQNLFQTVAAVNYLPIALVMADSLKKYITNARLSILINDGTPGLLSKIRNRFGDRAEFIGCEDLAMPNLAVMRRYYSVLEFSSACKILALHYQLSARGEPECFFIDPDMYVMGDFTQAARAAGKDIVLTQHSLSPYPNDGELPDEFELASSGAVNGGFIYVKESQASQRALAWLMEKIARHWFVAPYYGMYGDQQWLSFLPQFFADAVGITRHPGINLAYWNLHERPLRTAGRQLQVQGGIPALLFHFSGFSTAGDSRLSKHSKRLFDAETERCIALLIREYRTALEKSYAEVQEAGIVSGDLGFSRAPLSVRMAAAEKIHGQYYRSVIVPQGKGMALGFCIDRLLARWRAG